MSELKPEQKDVRCCFCIHRADCYRYTVKRIDCINYKASDKGEK